MKTIAVILASLLFTATSTSAQEPIHDQLLEHMTGSWVLAGTIAGQQTTHDVTVDWVLAHQYLQLHEVSREKDAAGQPAYEAIVFIGWDKTLGQYSCLWLDSTGGGGIAAHAIAHAAPAANELPFLFDIAGSIFHTTFAYNGETDTWRWIMDGEEDGKPQPFARVMLKRK
jgi:hypothetical protein